MAVANTGAVSPDRVLVVVAHPDDEVLGCGGTIARLAKERPVRVVILGEGITSRFADRADVAPRELAGLHAAAQVAGRVLGAERVEILGLPDNRFDELPLLDIVKPIERLVAEGRPTVIYTHHPGDLNIDHGLTFRAVLTATRPMTGCPVRAIYAVEVPSSTEWAFQRIAPAFRPNVFMDITNTIQTKIDALETYVSEVRPFPHPRSPEALRAIARRWGTTVGLEYAEAFELIRLIE